MQYNPINIISGTLILYFVSYLLITFFTFVYIGFLKNAHNKKASKILLATSLVSLAWLVSTFVSLAVSFSSGVLLFSILSLIFIFGFSYLFAKKTLNFTIKENLIYSFIAAIIFNPGWLVLMGVL